MEAIVLAGGFGTRLKHILPYVPKSMAMINGKPFLDYLLSYLKRNSVTHVVLAVGYLREQIIDYFNQSYKGMKLSYSEEISPLLTGGAIKKALKICSENNVFVLNGDTLFDVNLLAMLKEFNQQNASLMIAVKKMQDFSRYGTVIMKNGRITSFIEKQPQKSGFINGGTYLLKPDLLDKYPEAFSFEKDVMEQHIKELPIWSYHSSGYFLDIGVPEDYARAQYEFKNFGE